MKFKLLSFGSFLTFFQVGAVHGAIYYDTDYTNISRGFSYTPRVLQTANSSHAITYDSTATLTNNNSFAIENVRIIVPFYAYVYRPAGPTPATRVDYSWNGVQNRFNSTNEVNTSNYDGDSTELSIILSGNTGSMDMSDIVGLPSTFVWISMLPELPPSPFWTFDYTSFPDTVLPTGSIMYWDVGTINPGQTITSAYTMTSTVELPDGVATSQNRTYRFRTYMLSTTQIPEPSGFVMLSIGGIGLLLRRSRNDK